MAACRTKGGVWSRWERVGEPRLNGSDLSQGLQQETLAPRGGGETQGREDKQAMRIMVYCSRNGGGDAHSSRPRPRPMPRPRPRPRKPVTTGLITERRFRSAVSLSNGRANCFHCSTLIYLTLCRSPLVIGSPGSLCSCCSASPAKLTLAHPTHRLLDLH
jgi:hypothetical protein